MEASADVVAVLDENGVLLYANPGTQGFYSKLGFFKMNTAMAIWRDRARAIRTGLISEE